MSTRPFEGPRERKRARPVPDTDSLATDDRGTRPYQNPQPDEHDDPLGQPLPVDEPEQGREAPDGNYIGDPVKPDETIRADMLDGTFDLPDLDLPDDDSTPAGSDAPTIIREAHPPRKHSREP